MNKVKELEKAHHTAEEALRDARHARDEMRDNLIQHRVTPLLEQVAKEKRAIEKEVQQAHDKLVDDAAIAAHHVRFAYDAARVEAAAKDTGWYPVGTKVWLWESPRFGSNKPKYRTSTVAIVEVWSRDSLHHSRIGGWRLPTPGDLVLRMLKKDGTPAVQFISNPATWNRDHWFAEGDSPKQEVPHAAQA